MEAIEWFYNGKKSPPELKFNREKELEIFVEIEFVGVQQGIATMTTETHQTKLKKLIGDVDSVKIRKSSIDHKKYFWINGEELKNPAGLDSALNEFLPKLEFVRAKAKLEEVSLYKATSPIGQMLAGVLATIVEEDDHYKDFKNQFSDLVESEESIVGKELSKLGKQVEKYLQKQFPEGTKVKFSVETPRFDDLFKNFVTEVDDGIPTYAEEKGDGMQRAIMLAIIQAYAEFRKQKGEGKTFLFLIDEAELHLHPSGQRALKKALQDIVSEGDQVIVNTHSSVLIVDDEEQEIFKVEKAGGVTDIQRAPEEEKSQIIFELLGGSPADLLFPRNFLIVEGKSEFHFIKALIQRFYRATHKGIHVVFSGGDITEQEGSLLGIHKVFTPLATCDNPIYKEKVVIICDKPNSKQEAKYKIFREGYPYLKEDDQIFVLPYCCLEEYYPAPWVKNAQEIATMQGNGEKADYAKKVANEITQEVFESQMQKIFSALQACHAKAFNP